MFRSTAQQNRLAILAKNNPTYQGYINDNWSTPEFLRKTKEENFDIVLEAHKCLLQFGLVILPIDNGASNGSEMEASKDRIIRIYNGGQAKASFESVSLVFDHVIETDDGVESVSKNMDRFQSVVRRSTVDNVDQVYRTSCQVIEKFTTCMDHVLGVEVFKHSDTFEYTRLVSTEESTFQVNHCDFATNEENGWGKYMGAFNHSLMTPLSSIYFPEGGQLGYRNYQPRTIIQHYIDRYESIDQRVKLSLNQLAKQECDVEYRLADGTTFKPRKRVSETHFIRVEPGHMAIFGQHAIHQGAGYLERNLRYFRYLDFKSKF